MKACRILCALLTGASAVAFVAAAAPKSLTVSVAGEIAQDYQRTRLPDGTFQPEQYVIANGGKFPGTTRDSSFDKVSYPEVAGIVAEHLASRRYFLAKKAADADLLIVVYWGQTVGFNDASDHVGMDMLSQALAEAKIESLQSRISENNGSAEIRTGSGNLTGADSGRLEAGVAMVAMENRHRDMMNEQNAKILGYLDPINEARWRMAWADIGGIKQDLMNDVEEDRYYVVVGAYDFREMKRSGKKVPKWITRISIGSRGTSFDERVRQMVASAASAFGEGQGLHRRFYGDPRVELGELQFLGQASVPEKKDK